MVTFLLILLKSGDIISKARQSYRSRVSFQSAMKSLLHQAVAKAERIVDVIFHEPFQNSSCLIIMGAVS